MAKPKIEDEQLDEWLENEDERLALNRRSSSIKRRQGVLEAHFTECLKASRSKSIKRRGCRLYFKLAKAPVRWKDKLIEKIGRLAVDEIEESMPQGQKLVIEQVDKSG